MNSWILSAFCGTVLISTIAGQTVEMVCPLLPKPSGSDTCDNWCQSHPGECNPNLCKVLDQPGDDPDDYKRSGCTERNKRCCSTPCQGTRCVPPVVQGCYTYQWQCYGAHTSLPDRFGATSQGPMAYLDGQSTTGNFAGHVREWEYDAHITGVEVTFNIFVPYNDFTPENELKLYHTFKHTARELGLQKIIMDIELPEKCRIGFEVMGNTGVPMKYRIGKPDGGRYTSFIGYKMEGDKYVWDMPSVNRQYIFRLCFDTRRDTDMCPIPSTVPPSTTTSIFTTPSPSECIFMDQPLGCFGQGVPRHDGTHVTSVRSRGYTSIDIDGASQLPDGVITELQYRVWKIASFTFQVWRPNNRIPGVISGRMKLIHSLVIHPFVTEEVQEVRGVRWQVRAKDRIGWTYTGSGSPPIKYNVTLNVPNREPYMTLECNGCANNVVAGDEVVFPVQRYQKQYRIRVCMLRTVLQCPPTLPPGVTTKDPTCRMEYKEDACYGVPEPVGLVGMMEEAMKYFYIDTEAELTTGFLTSIRFVPNYPDPFHFQVWRKDRDHSTRLMLVYDIRVRPRTLNQLNTLDLQSPASVKEGDMFGFKFMTRSVRDMTVPMMYDVAENNVGGAYNTYECKGNCMLEHDVEVGGMLTIPGQRVRKRFRIGTCVSNLKEVCGPTVPITGCEVCPPGPPGPQGPPGPAGRKRRDVNIELVDDETAAQQEEISVFDTKVYNIALLVWIAVLTVVMVTYPIVACTCWKRGQFVYRDMDKPRM